jgi:thiamine-phosphate pyrophosphorylase
MQFKFSLYLVTDQQACLGRDFYWVLEEALRGGVDLVQLREKTLDTNAFIEKGRRTKDICMKYQVPLIINDSPDVALACQADALHIGQKDATMATVKDQLGESFPVGLSLDQMDDLFKIGSEQAWYYGVSPIFSTPTKPDTLSEWGLDGLTRLREKTDKPLVAIGNIKPENAKEVIKHGADCIAVVSAICSAEGPAQAASELREIIEKSKNG